MKISAAARQWRRSAWERLAPLARQHKPFALVLGLGGFLRLLAMAGYPGVVWFPGDSYLYLGAAMRPMPDLSKTVGYSLFVRALEPFHSFILLSLVQHLMGLSVALLLYVLMMRAGVPRRWATLASLPVLLDGNQIELEHMLMAETLFTFLAVIAVTLMLWRPRPSWRACLVAGLLVGYSITVRSEGIPLPVVLLAFIAVRRIGWRPAAAALAGCVLPVAAYVAWFHSYTGDYGLTRSEGFYLWGRVSTFADCSQINPPASERRLCLPMPPSQRQAPGQIIWLAPQVHQDLPYSPVSARGNQALRDFAIRAVLAQPAGYLHALADGLVLAVDWRRLHYPSEYTTSHYYFHLSPWPLPGNRAWIPGGTPASDARAYGRAPASRVFLPAALPIAAYQRMFFTYGPLFGIIMVTGLVGLIRFRRRVSPGGHGAGPGGRSAVPEDTPGPRRPQTPPAGHAPGLLPWGAAAALLAFPIAVADFDYRYLLPVLPFACVAAGMAFARPRPAGEPAPPGRGELARPAGAGEAGGVVPPGQESGRDPEPASVADQS